MQLWVMPTGRGIGVWIDQIDLHTDVMLGQQIPPVVLF